MSASLLAHITSSSPTTHNDEDREEAANTWNLDVKERSLAHLRLFGREYAEPGEDGEICAQPTGDGLLHVQLEGQGENHSPLARDIFVHVEPGRNVRPLSSAIPTLY